MPQYCFTTDLKNDPQLIAEYEAYHQKIWPEIAASITDAGIISMEIFRIENRLFMMMETTDDFSFDKKAAMDAANEKVQEWEELMWKYQQELPFAKPGEKWLPAHKIFDLKVNA